MLVRGRQWIKAAPIMFLGLLCFSPAAAQQQSPASVSARAGEPNAVFVTVPNDPCASLYGKLSDRLTGLELDFGPVEFDQRTYFLKYCNEKKDELVARIKAPFEAAKSQAEDAANAAAAELTGGFWTFMAEQLYARLPPEEQAKYAPGSPEVQALSHRWLNEAPQEEFGTYVAAYLTAGGQESRLLNAWKVYVDLTEGESKSILDGLHKLLNDARTRLTQILDAKDRIASEPDTPIADIIREVGLSGEWVEYFQGREAQIRGLNSQSRLAEVTEIVSDAMGSEDPSDKVRAFFRLMGLTGDIATESNQPLIAFVGQLIKSYADVANQVLDNTLALDDIIQERNGYCLGVGAASRDVRQSFFVDLGVLACPLNYGTWPFKHVYQTVNVPQQTYFYDGSSFVLAEHGDVRVGVAASIKLIKDAIALGYPVISDPDAHIARIAAVFNTADPGGIPGLMAEARAMVANIQEAVSAVQELALPGDSCSSAQILADVSRDAGFSNDSFLRDLTDGGSDRLASAIAASFVAFEGRFGRGASRGDSANAYETYAELADALSGVTVLVLEGRVFNSDRSPVPGARLNIDINVGRQVRGCEFVQADSAGRFAVYAVGDGRSMSISGRADSAQTRGTRDTFDVSYFRRNGSTYVERNGGVTARADVELIVPETDEPPGNDPGKDKTAEPGDEPPPAPVTEEQSPECAVVDAVVEQVRQRLSSGFLGLLSEFSDDLERAVAGAGDLGACGSKSVSGVATAQDLLATARREIASVDGLLGQCDATAIALKSAALAPLGGISFEQLISRLEFAAQGISLFDEALAYYKNNALDTAKRALTNLPGIFGPDCQNYHERIAQGLRQIEALEQFDARLGAAIGACDAGLLEAMSAEIANRDHKFFGEARAQIEAGLVRCVTAEQEDVAAKSCAAATVELNRARASYKSNDFGPASAALSTAQAHLDAASNQHCPEIGSRIAQGHANIAVIRQAEADLQSALGSCDVERLTRLRAQASSQNHLWFQQATGRIDAGLHKCESGAVNGCEVLRARSAEAGVLFDAGEFDASLTALQEANEIAMDTDAVVGCVEDASQVAGGLRLVERLVGLVGRVESAITACSANDIESLLSEVARTEFSNVGLDAAKARLEAARADCARPEPIPDRIATAEPSIGAGDEGAGALEIMRDAEAKLTSTLLQIGNTRFRRSVPTGDSRSASIVYSIEADSLTNDVLTATTNLEVHLKLTQFPTGAEAVPVPGGGETLDTGSLSFPMVIAITNEKAASARFAKARYRLELVARETGFRAFNESGTDDRLFPAVPFTLMVVAHYYHEALDPDL